MASFFIFLFLSSPPSSVLLFKKDLLMSFNFNVQESEKLIMSAREGSRETKAFVQKLSSTRSGTKISNVRKREIDTKISN